MVLPIFSLVDILERVEVDYISHVSEALFYFLDMYS